jgi:hypothetical protein
MRIRNRSLSTRSWSDKSACCRLCGGGRDRLSHLSECPVMLKHFSCFESPPSPAMIYLGLRKDLSPLTGSGAVLYRVAFFVSTGFRLKTCTLMSSLLRKVSRCVVLLQDT